MACDDASLWTRVRAGDAQAFGCLFERHGSAIYAYCFRRTADASRAADLTSVTFLEAWRRRHVAVDGDKVLPWLFGVATNLLRNERRALRRYRAALGRLPAAEVEQDFTDDLTHRLDANARMREALRLLKRLSKGERNVFILVEWQGLSPEDAADGLGISAAAARTRLSRARSRLARLALPENSESAKTTDEVRLS